MLLLMSAKNKKENKQRKKHEEQGIVYWVLSPKSRVSVCPCQSLHFNVCTSYDLQPVNVPH